MLVKGLSKVATEERTFQLAEREALLNTNRPPCQRSWACIRRKWVRMRPKRKQRDKAQQWSSAGGQWPARTCQNALLPSFAPYISIPFYPPDNTSLFLPPPAFGGGSRAGAPRSHWALQAERGSSFSERLCLNLYVPACQCESVRHQRKERERETAESRLTPLRHPC
ncbi:hypothetical protein AOLI_G00313340 [Acnodon oligacanthus]